MPTPVNQEYRAFLAWNILTDKAREHRTLTYGELGRLVGVHHRVTRFFLAPIQSYCLDHHLPPLTILVVNQSDSPGTGFIAWDVDRLEEGRQEVFGHNWGSAENPFSFAVNGSVESQIIEELVSDPTSSGEVYGRIKIRGVVQSIFRQALLKVYGSSCAVCGLTFEVALDAAHIIAWSDCSEKDRLNIQNGLLLCSVHHKLFDAGAFFLTNGYAISVNEANPECPIVSESDRKQLSYFDGMRIRLPLEENKQPGQAFIRAHRNQFKPL